MKTSELIPSMMRPTACVLVPLPFDKAFDYLMPDEMALQEGDFVRVPFGSREVYGVVWGFSQSDSPKLKTIAAKADHLPAMTDAMRRFIDWVADYTMAAKGAVLKMSLTSPDALSTPATQTHYTLKADAKPSTKARQKVFDLLEDGFARTATQIAKEAGVTASVIRGWSDGLKNHELTMQPKTPHYEIMFQPQLSTAQKTASEVLTAKLGQGFSTTVIDGVTGSGKTEVYFEVIEAFFALGSQLSEQTTGNHPSQILILLPEIALSVQWLQRFKARFGGEPYLWHSSVSTATKRETWRAVVSGDAQIVVGARSALFLPFRNLATIIIDEEHEGSFKQEEGVIYHARDMAVARASIENIPIILASATPSLETLVNIEQGKYNAVTLPARHGGASLPEVELIDMREHKPPANHWISEPLNQAITDTISQGNQAMLFLNRRGYAPLTLCRTCGYRFGCPHCSSWLVMHEGGRVHGNLHCHHCEFRTPLPAHCPECGEVAEDCLAACGPGVERIAAEATRLFPDLRIAQMTSDILQTPEQIEKLVEAIANRQIDLLIGTQMMAKGHHFPNLALVGIVDADMGLAGGDLRAGERCWQLLHQLAGRAGRGEVAGKVMIQSYLPAHPVMMALATHDRDGFFELEKNQRAIAKMPPFGKLAGLVIEGKNENQVEAFARKIAQTAPERKDLRCIGPTPAPMAYLRGKYRYRLLIKAERTVKLQAVLREWLAPLKIPSALKLKIDIDPYSFM